MLGERQGARYHGSLSSLRLAFFGDALNAEPLFRGEKEALNDQQSRNEKEPRHSEEEQCQYGLCHLAPGRPAAQFSASWWFFVLEFAVGDLERSLYF